MSISSNGKRGCEKGIVKNVWVVSEGQKNERNVCICRMKCIQVSEYGWIDQSSVYDGVGIMRERFRNFAVVCRDGRVKSTKGEELCYYHESLVACVRARSVPHPQRYTRTLGSMRHSLVCSSKEGQAYQLTPIACSIGQLSCTELKRRLRSRWRRY